AEAERPQIVHAIGNYRVAIPALSVARRSGSGFIYERAEFSEYSGEARTADWISSDLFLLERSLEAIACSHSGTVLVATQRQLEEVHRTTAGRSVDVEHLPMPTEATWRMNRAEARTA